MTALINAVRYLYQQVVSSIAARTSTVTSAAFDMLDYEGQVLFTQFVGTVSGTTPTLNGKLQHCETSGGTYADISGAVFTQVIASDAHETIAINTDAVYRYVRYVGTIAGTTPSFAMGVLAAGFKKYN